MILEVLIIMDVVQNVQKEVDKVLSKFSSLDQHSVKTLTDLMNQVNCLKRDLDLLTPKESEMTSIQREILSTTTKKIRDVVSQVASEHRDLHGTVSKVGKAIDRNFVSEFASVANESLFDDDESRRQLKTKVLNEALVEHLLRQGMLEIADELIRESELRDVSSETRTLFHELNHILDALKNRNLEPAVEWTHKNREILIQQSSCLEFKLHRLKFIEMLLEGKSREMDLINYARRHLQPLAVRHEKEVQSLMGSLLYLKSGVKGSAYSYFMDEGNWGDICRVFTRDACALLGLSVESPLEVAFDAGTLALPALLNIRKVMQQRKVPTIWTAKDELPIEIDLGRDKQFHSIFACPILRAQCSESNPPMRLVCGHVISRDALNKLSNMNKLKCPYCPLEQNTENARQIFF